MTTPDPTPPPPANQCGFCKQPKIVLVVYADNRQCCATCYIDGAFHAKIGSPQFKRDDESLPAPGSHAGTSLATGHRYTYTDQVIDLKTGERRPRQP